MLENPSSPVEHKIASNTKTIAQLSGSWLRFARLAWIVLALAAAAILVTSLPAYWQTFSGDLAHVSAESQNEWTAILAALSGVASLGAALLSLGLALLFFRRRFGEPMAATLSFYLVLYAIVMAGPLEKWAAYWLEDDTLALRLQGLLIAMPSIAMFAVFPNGRFSPKWSRWLVILTLPLSLALFLLPSYNPADLSDFGKPGCSGRRVNRVVCGRPVRAILSLSPRVFAGGAAANEVGDVWFRAVAGLYRVGIYPLLLPGRPAGR